jgi:glycosyltransferase involved in cell wall biosynthesis
VKISVIIPTYEAADQIGALTRFFMRYGSGMLAEIIVSDGGSEDDTRLIAERAGALAIRCPRKGRTARMNYGATFATGDILYFCYPGNFPPKSFAADIIKAVKNGNGSGRFICRFKSWNPVLIVIAFFMRFDLFNYSAGNKTLFITKQVFESIHGFNDTENIMDDNDIVTRVKKASRYKIIQKAAYIHIGKPGRR